MYFPLKPPKNSDIRESHYVHIPNAFNDEEIAKIIQIGEINLSPAQLRNSDGENTDSFTEVRKSKVSWIQFSQNNAWIYQKMASFTDHVNKTFGYDLFGFVDELQYTVYHASGDHYNWHMDKGALSSSPRKLSITLQLSDPSEYQGGDFQFFFGSEPFTAEKAKGTLYAFPSYLMHRVSPVFSGTRRSLVAWVSGPSFK